MQWWSERLRNLWRVCKNRWFLCVAAVMLLTFSFEVLVGFPSGAGFDGLHQYIDGAALIWICGLFVITMYLTDSWKDFINGVWIVFVGGREISRIELQRAVKVMAFAEKMVLIESIIPCMIRATELLYRMEPITSSGPVMAFIFLSVLYCALFLCFLEILKSRLEKMFVSFMEEPEEETEREPEDEGQAVYFRLRAIGLTDREAEVARLVSLGLANKEVARQLYISDSTVKKHMTHILEKTGCTDREALREKIKKL